MSREITITLEDDDLATLQEYVADANRLVEADWQTTDNAVAQIVRQWLFDRRTHKAFMLQLEKDVEEINARKAKKELAE